jgi:hypothetical protein
LEEIERIDELSKKAQELENSDHSRASFWQALVTNNIKSQMASLAERTGLDPTSPELLKMAHEGASVLEPPLLHSAFLWDGIACSGAVLPLLTGVPFPTLSWVGFNDRASSVTGFASTITLWEKSWFGGRAAFMFSIGACIHLLDLNFSNIASSAITL